jgi:hypothetical protein
MIYVWFVFVFFFFFFFFCRLSRLYKYYVIDFVLNLIFLFFSAKYANVTLKKQNDWLAWHFGEVHRRHNVLITKYPLPLKTPRGQSCGKLPHSLTLPLRQFPRYFDNKTNTTIRIDSALSLTYLRYSKF